LKTHLENSNKKIIELKQTVEYSKKVKDGQVAPDDLVRDFRDKELKVAQHKAKLEDLRDSFKIKEEIFNSNKSYQDGLLNELKSLQIE